MEDITIGSAVSSIERWAFYHCSKLTSVTSMATTAPSIYNADVFDASIKSVAVLRVPKGSKASYESSSSWWPKYFTNIVEME